MSEDVKSSVIDVANLLNEKKQDLCFQVCNDDYCRKSNKRYLKKLYLLLHFFHIQDDSMTSIFKSINQFSSEQKLDDSFNMLQWQTNCSIDCYRLSTHMYLFQTTMLLLLLIIRKYDA